MDINTYIEFIEFENEILHYNLLEETKIFISRCGFEIIEERIESTENFPVKFTLFDLFPLKTPIKDIDGNIYNDELFNNNYRLQWAKLVIIKYLNKELNQKKYNVKLSSEIFKINTLKNINTLNKELTDYIKCSISKFEVPYKIIKEFTNFGCNNRTDLVQKNKKIYVCKTFKPDRNKYLANEILVRGKIKNDVLFPKIIETGENYILFEYIDGAKPIYYMLNRFKKYPIDLQKSIFSDLKKIWDRGIILLDFHPGNILIDNNKNLYFIDFEYASLRTNERSFISGPSFIEPNKLFYYGPLDEITYEKCWKQNIYFKSAYLFGNTTINILSKLFNLKDYSQLYIKKLIRKLKKLFV